jgi:LPS-assembly lipoprotein
MVKRWTWTLLAGVLLLVGLAGCGFQLRGQSQLPFDSAFVEANANSGLGKALRNSLALENKLADKAENATIRVLLAEESRAKSILALSGGGKVREYRLTLRFLFAVYDAKGRELVAPSEMVQVRDYSYNDSELLAKTVEEATLYRSMEQNALQQVLRRLSFIPR